MNDKTETSSDANNAADASSEPATPTAPEAAPAAPATKAEKKIASARTAFAAHLPNLNNKTFDQTKFRKEVIGDIMTATGCSLASAASMYNVAKKEAELAKSITVALGRQPKAPVVTAEVTTADAAPESNTEASGDETVTEIGQVGFVTGDSTDASNEANSTDAPEELNWGVYAEDNSLVSKHASRSAARKARAGGQVVREIVKSTESTAA